MWLSSVCTVVLVKTPRSSVTRRVKSADQARSLRISVSAGEGGVAVGGDVYNFFLSDAAKSIPLRDVPMLEFCRQTDPKQGFPHPGMRLTDRPEEDSETPPVLFFDVFVKKSRLFDRHPVDENQKWLYVEANIRPALNLRIQVRAWNLRDEVEIVSVLRGGRDSWALHGPRPEANEQHAGDYFYVWQEGGEYRMMLSTFTATNAGISVHARLSEDVAKELADYLRRFGFASDDEMNTISQE